MKILVAVEAVDGRKGIDSLVRLCQEQLATDPSRVVCLSFAVGEQRRSVCCIRRPGILACTEAAFKRRFKWWVKGKTTCQLEAHQAQLLLAGAIRRRRRRRHGGKWDEEEGLAF